MHRASKANSQQEEDDALYRAGTHMEVLDTNRANLSPEQREAVRNAAKEVLGE